MINLNYQFKLKPSKEQIAIFENILDVCKDVHNYALKERKDWSASRKSDVNSCGLIQYIIPADQPYPNYHEQSRNLTVAKENGSIAFLLCGAMSLSPYHDT